MIQTTHDGRPELANFRLLRAGFDVGPALAELTAHEPLWHEITVRQDYAGSAHRDTQTIFLRGPSSPLGAFTEIPAFPYPALETLNACADLTMGVALTLRATEVGRVMVVRLQAGGHITPHVDEGAYAAHYQRAHLVLASEPGNTFACGDETVHMRPGELWWFDHHQVHEVTNRSTAWRTHLIVDVVSPDLEH